MYQSDNSTQNTLFVTGAAPSNQIGCMKGGVGVAILDEYHNFVHGETMTVDRPTDNSELELIALVEGLELAKDGDSILSNSEFCVKGFNEWLDGWKSRGWRKSNNKPIAYRQLWQMVDELRSRKFVYVIKAREITDGSEKAAELAMLAAMR